MAELPTMLVSIELIPAEPGRALDIRVGREIMGLLFCDTSEPADPSGMCSLWGRAHYSANGIDADTQEPVPAYSADVAAAWTVVARLHAQGLHLMLEQARTRDQYELDGEVGGPGDKYVEAGQWIAHFQDVVTRGTGLAATAPLAICLAALATRELQHA